MYTDGHNCDIVSGLIIGYFSQYLKELQAIKCITNDCFTMVKWSKENIKKSNYNDMQNSTSVMVNISTNFSKANNHLHLHSLDVKQTTTLTSEPCLGQAQQCGGYGIPNFPSCIQFISIIKISMHYNPVQVLLECYLRSYLVFASLLYTHLIY